MYQRTFLGFMHVGVVLSSVAIHGSIDPSGDVIYTGEKVVGATQKSK